MPHLTSLLVTKYDGGHLVDDRVLGSQAITGGGKEEVLAAQVIIVSHGLGHGGRDT